MTKQLLADAHQVAKFPCLAGMTLEQAQAFAEQAECWETQEWACDAVLDVELMTPIIIDPCCGPGVMSEAAARRGYHVRPTDLNDWGYGELRDADFLSDGYPIPVEGHTVFMNSPFSLACEFVDKAWERGARKVVAFQQFSWRESVERATWWERRPPNRVYVCASRASPMLVVIAPENRKGKSNPKAHAFYVWERGQPAGTVLGALYRRAK